MKNLLAVWKKFSRGEKLLLVSYTVLLVFSFLYSYTQTDLSLTFSRMEFLRNLIFSFQHIGYFDRLLSAGIFIALIVCFSAFYLLFLSLAQNNAIKKHFVWAVLFLTTGILAFSYNAFSHDLFNYIFDAKIITEYGQNPYMQKALDYPEDPMLSFMHWTHRTYPYGPVWLALTVPLSYLGFNLFIPTFLLFKALMAASFLGSVYFIGKIFQKIAPDKELFGLVFFGLNPLLIFESLISAHLDIVMLFFCLWAFYSLQQKKHALSLVLLFISIGIKFATGFLLPVFLWVMYLQRRNKPVEWQKVFLIATFLMAISVIAVSLRTNFQPWYLVEVLFVAVFLSSRYYIFSPMVIISLFAVLTYLPYLYLGTWDKPVPQILSTLYITSYIVAGFVVLGEYLLVRGKFFQFPLPVRKSKLSPVRLKMPRNWK